MVKNPYAYRNNVPADLVSVFEVDRHAGDEYFCPQCGDKLIAVQPADSRKQWFFRHHNLEDCGASYESVLHLVAKQIVAEEKQIMLPKKIIKPEPWVYQKYKCHRGMKPYYMGNRYLCKFDSVQEEVWVDGRRPDLIAHKGDGKIFIEIVVTHGIDEEKLNWIKEQDVSTLVVELAGFGYHFGKEKLREWLVTGKTQGWEPPRNVTKWAYHKKEKDYQGKANQHYINQVKRAGLYAPPATTVDIARHETDLQPDHRVIDRQMRLF